MSYTVNEIYTQAPSHVLGCLWMLTPSEQWWWCVYERECVFVCVCVCVSACACIPAHALPARRTETQKTYIFKISFIKDIYA